MSNVCCNPSPIALIIVIAPEKNCFKNSYKNFENVAKAFEISKAQIEAQSRYLRIKGKEIEEYQKILSYIIFSNSEWFLCVDRIWHPVYNAAIPHEFLP